MTEFESGGRTFNAELSGDMLIVYDDVGGERGSVFVGTLPIPEVDRVFVPQDESDSVESSQEAL
ncbi:hypothetical protein [Rhodococcus sp. NPDC006774]|uniref:hypothetical protein n=1 Tax=Rhodococcus sp. NPDC006774 TaxID=3157186 RepID=UPI0033E3BD17